MEMSITLMRLGSEQVVEDNRRLLQKRKKLVLSWKIRRIEILFLHLSGVDGDGSVIPNMIILNGKKKNHCQKFFFSFTMIWMEKSPRPSVIRHTTTMMSWVFIGLSILINTLARKEKGYGPFQSRSQTVYSTVSFPKNILLFRLPPHTAHLL